MLPRLDFYLKIISIPVNFSKMNRHLTDVRIDTQMVKQMTKSMAWTKNAQRRAVISNW